MCSQLPKPPPSQVRVPARFSIHALCSQRHITTTTETLPLTGYKRNPTRLDTQISSSKSTYMHSNVHLVIPRFFSQQRSSIDFHAQKKLLTDRVSQTQSESDASRATNQVGAARPIARDHPLFFALFCRHENTGSAIIFAKRKFTAP